MRGAGPARALRVVVFWVLQPQGRVSRFTEQVLFRDSEEFSRGPSSPKTQGVTSPVAGRVSLELLRFLGARGFWGQTGVSALARPWVILLVGGMGGVGRFVRELF